MNDEQRRTLLESANQMPTEAVLQLRKVLGNFFKEANIPFDASHLKACLEMTNLLHSAIPPIHSQFVVSNALLLVRLIEEEESGLIKSPIEL